MTDQAGDQQHGGVGQDHDQDADTRSDGEIADHFDLDHHQRSETDTVRNQRREAWHVKGAKGETGRAFRVLAR